MHETLITGPACLALKSHIHLPSPRKMNLEDNMLLPRSGTRAEPPSMAGDHLFRNKWTNIDKNTKPASTPSHVMSARMSSLCTWFPQTRVTLTRFSCSHTDSSCAGTCSMFCQRCRWSLEWERQRPFPRAEPGALSSKQILQNILIGNSSSLNVWM